MPLSSRKAGADDLRRYRSTVKAATKYAQNQHRLSQKQSGSFTRRESIRSRIGDNRHDFRERKETEHSMQHLRGRTPSDSRIPSQRRRHTRHQTNIISNVRDSLRQISPESRRQQRLDLSASEILQPDVLLTEEEKLQLLRHHRFNPGTPERYIQRDTDVYSTNRPAQRSQTELYSALGIPEPSFSDSVTYSDRDLRFGISQEYPHSLDRNSESARDTTRNQRKRRDSTGIDRPLTKIFGSPYGNKPHSRSHSSLNTSRNLFTTAEQTRRDRGSHRPKHERSLTPNSRYPECESKPSKRRRNRSRNAADRSKNYPLTPQRFGERLDHAPNAVGTVVKDASLTSQTLLSSILESRKRIHQTAGSLPYSNVTNTTNLDAGGPSGIPASLDQDYRKPMPMNFTQQQIAADPAVILEPKIEPKIIRQFSEITPVSDASFTAPSAGLNKMSDIFGRSTPQNLKGLLKNLGKLKISFKVDVKPGDDGGFSTKGNYEALPLDHSFDPNFNIIHVHRQPGDGEKELFDRPELVGILTKEILAPSGGRFVTEEPDVLSGRKNKEKFADRSGEQFDPVSNHPARNIDFSPASGDFDDDGSSSHSSIDLRQTTLVDSRIVVAERPFDSNTSEQTCDASTSKSPKHPLKKLNPKQKVRSRRRNASASANTKKIRAASSETNHKPGEVSPAKKARNANPPTPAARPLMAKEATSDINQKSRPTSQKNGAQQASHRRSPRSCEVLSRSTGTKSKPPKLNRKHIVRSAVNFSNKKPKVQEQQYIELDVSDLRFSLSPSPAPRDEAKTKGKSLVRDSSPLYDVKRGFTRQNYSSTAIPSTVPGLFSDLDFNMAADRFATEQMRSDFLRHFETQQNVSDKLPPPRDRHSIDTYETRRNRDQLNKYSDDHHRQERSHSRSHSDYSRSAAQARPTRSRLPGSEILQARDVFDSNGRSDSKDHHPMHSPSRHSANRNSPQRCHEMPPPRHLHNHRSTGRTDVKQGSSSSIDDNRKNFDHHPRYRERDRNSPSRQQNKSSHGSHSSDHESQDSHQKSHDLYRQDHGPGPRHQTRDSHYVSDHQSRDPHQHRHDSHRQGRDPHQQSRDSHHQTRDSSQEHRDSRPGSHHERRDSRHRGHDSHQHDRDLRHQTHDSHQHDRDSQHQVRDSHHERRDSHLQNHSRHQSYGLRPQSPRTEFVHRRTASTLEDQRSMKPHDNAHQRFNDSRPKNAHEIVDRSRAKVSGQRQRASSAASSVQERYDRFAHEKR